MNFVSNITKRFSPMLVILLAVFSVNCRANWTPEDFDFVSKRLRQMFSEEFSPFSKNLLKTIDASGPQFVTDTMIAEVVAQGIQKNLGNLVGNPNSFYPGSPLNASVLSELKKISEETGLIQLRKAIRAALGSGENWASGETAYLIRDLYQTIVLVSAVAEQLTSSIRAQSDREPPKAQLLSGISWCFRAISGLHY